MGGSGTESCGEKYSGTDTKQYQRYRYLIFSITEKLALLILSPSNTEEGSNDHGPNVKFPWGRFRVNCEAIHQRLPTVNELDPRLGYPPHLKVPVTEFAILRIVHLNTYARACVKVYRYSCTCASVYTYVCIGFCMIYTGKVPCIHNFRTFVLPAATQYFLCAVAQPRARHNSCQRVA